MKKDASNNSNDNRVSHLLVTTQAYEEALKQADEAARKAVHPAPSAGVGVEINPRTMAIGIAVGGLLWFLSWAANAIADAVVTITTR